MPEVIKPIIKIPALPPFWRSLLCEFIGTYVLVYVISQTNDLYNQSDLAALAIGFTLTSLVFSLAHHNSGCFNPAVSFGLYLLGFMTSKEFFGQFLAQTLGGFFAGLTSLAFYGGGGFPVCVPNDNLGAGIGKAFVAEFVGTSVLVMTVTQVAASKQRGNHFFGLCIGFTVLGQAIAGGKWSGGAFNPAVTSSLQFVKCIGGECVHLKYLPLYMLAELLGSVNAFLFFCLTGSYAEGEGTHDETFEADNRVNEAFSRVTKIRDDEDDEGNLRDSRNYGGLRDSRSGGGLRDSRKHAGMSNDSAISLSERTKNLTASEKDSLIPK